jgi:hypothetical protein
VEKYEPSVPDCIYLDHRFATRVMPDAEEAAELNAQDQCAEFINGERCYFKLSDTQASICRFEAAVANSLTPLITKVMFESIVRPLQDSPQEDVDPEN